MKQQPIDDHERLLGVIVASFQDLELVLIEYLAGLVSWQDREVGYIISDGIPFKRLVTTVDALAKHREAADYYKTLKPLLEECLKLEEQRNRFVHGYWDVTPTKKNQLGWIWFKRKNRLGKGNIHSEAPLPSDSDEFKRRSVVLRDAIRSRIRKPQ